MKFKKKALYQEESESEPEFEEEESESEEVEKETEIKKAPPSNIHFCFPIKIKKKIKQHQ